MTGDLVKLGLSQEEAEKLMEILKKIQFFDYHDLLEEPLLHFLMKAREQLK